jgi:hypothetical protein
LRKLFFLYAGEETAIGYVRAALILRVTSTEDIPPKDAS